jgi:hypothetical protein
MNAFGEQLVYDSNGTVLNSLTSEAMAMSTTNLNYHEEPWKKTPSKNKRRKTDVQVSQNVPNAPCEEDELVNFCPDKYLRMALVRSRSLVAGPEEASRVYDLLKNEV